MLYILYKSRSMQVASNLHSRICLQHLRIRAFAFSIYPFAHLPHRQCREGCAWAARTGGAWPPAWGSSSSSSTSGPSSGRQSWAFGVCSSAVEFKVTSRPNLAIKIKNLILGLAYWNNLLPVNLTLKKCPKIAFSL